jgi:hypothetical protein
MSLGDSPQFRIMAEPSLGQRYSSPTQVRLLGLSVEDQPGGLSVGTLDALSRSRCLGYVCAELSGVVNILSVRLRSLTIENVGGADDSRLYIESTSES